MYKFIFTATMVLGAALPVQAMPGASGTDRFAAMDTNTDGRVGWEEFEISMPQMRREAFDTIDLNKDTAISKEEWDSFRKNHSMQPGAKPGLQPGMGKDTSTAPAAPAGKPLIQPPSN